MTREEALNLKLGDIIHHNINKNYDGTCQRWRVNGKIKTWKTRPKEFRIPLKHGLKMFDYLTERELNLVHLPGSQECNDE